MFGSPDDTSCVDGNDSDSYMPTISDSDLVRDEAKRVHWHPLPTLTDPAASRASLPLRSLDSLIQPDGASSKSNKGLRNVKAKMKAVARFLSASKAHQASSDAVDVSDKGIPVAGQGLPSIVVTQNRDLNLGQQSAIRIDISKPARVSGARAGERGGSVDRPAIDSLRERLVMQQEWHRPPPPPRLSKVPSLKQPELLPMKLAPHLSRPPTAVMAKKRHPNGPETSMAFARHEPPRTRSATPHPAHPIPIHVVSRPLPPTPAALPTQSTSLPMADQHQQHQQERSSIIANHLAGLGFSDSIRTLVDEPGNLSDDTLADTHVDEALRLERFPSIRSRANGLFDANRLAEELDSIVSFSEQRLVNHKARSAASSITAADNADSSREAVYHWHPSDEPAHAIASFSHRHEQQRMKEKRKMPVQTSMRSSSMFVESSSEEPESVKRIQNWRVNITQAPSVLSKAASAHSRFKGEDDGVSSHLTSVSRSPLSKKSVERGTWEKKREGMGKEDPNWTPTLRAERMINLGCQAAQPVTASSPGSVKSTAKPAHQRSAATTTSSLQLGTNHIARLSDAQFDRLACATEAPMPPPFAAIPYDSSFSSHLQPAAPPTTPNHINSECRTDDDRRTSLDAAATTLSVLEKKASRHINTLDLMIRRHPNKMKRIFKDRPGLMLVVLLRCKVEDRISEVQSVVGSKAAPPLVDGSRAGEKDEERKDGISLIEESLINLSFDDEEVSQPATSSAQRGHSAAQQQQPAEAQSKPGIMISQHRTGLSQSNPPPSSVSTAAPYLGTTIVANEADQDHPPANTIADIGPRGEAALETILHHLEQAGELCSVQQALISLQDRMIKTTSVCSRLRERLSHLEQAFFLRNDTPSTTFASLRV